MLILNLLAATALLVLFVSIIASLALDNYFTDYLKDRIEEVVKVSAGASALFLVVLYFSTPKC